MAETKHTISTKLCIDATLRLASSSPSQSGAAGDVTGVAMTPCGGSESGEDGDGAGAKGFLIVLRHLQEGASLPPLLRFLRLTQTPGVLVCVGDATDLKRRHVTHTCDADAWNFRWRLDVYAYCLKCMRLLPSMQRRRMAQHRRGATMRCQPP